jgi:hypothetical protein
MGTAIRNLPQITDLAVSDQLPLNSTDAGCDVRVALSVLADFIQSLLTVPTALLTQYAAPSATGFSVTVAPPEDGDSVWLLLTPAAGYATGTIVLPAQSTLADGQELLCNCTQAVTTLTVSGSGATVVGAPTTLAANAFFRLRYDGVTLKHYRVG